MNNKPTLFVSSISLNERGSENQNSFDSRMYLKSKVLHRLDDIIAFRYIGKTVVIKVSHLGISYIGEVMKINSQLISLKTIECEVDLLINQIDEITLLTIS